MEKIIYFLIVGFFIMSASDFLPKRNYLRRVFTVSKLHQWFGTLICIFVLFLISKENGILLLSGLGMGVFVLINNGLRLWKYLPFHPKKIDQGSKVDVQLLALNVRQKNEDHERALKLINSENADVLVLTETNARWANAIKSLDDSYPFQVKVPLENTYGMMLFSKFEILKHEVRYLVSDEVPSIHSQLNIKGQEIHLMLIHPEPPLDFKSLRNKDLEILKVSIEEDKTNMPTILCGDLNDVGWSYASRHMCEQTNLEDPRIGRGFFNSYNAHIPFFRYPIDHFFISPSFKVVEMRVLEKCGSDHFPVRISLELPSTGDSISKK